MVYLVHCIIFWMGEAYRRYKLNVQRIPAKAGTCIVMIALVACKRKNWRKQKIFFGFPSLKQNVRRGWWRTPPTSPHVLLLCTFSCSATRAAGFFYVNQPKVAVGAVDHFFAAIIVVDDDFGCTIAQVAGSANCDRAAAATVFTPYHTMVSLSLH